MHEMTSNPVEEDVGKEHEKSQAALIGFLKADLELGFTLLGIAKTKPDTDPNHSKSAVAKARDALRTIRRFRIHVEDPVASANIGARAEALEKALDALRVWNEILLSGFLCNRFYYEPDEAEEKMAHSARLPEFNPQGAAFSKLPTRRYLKLLFFEGTGRLAGTPFFRSPTKFLELSQSWFQSFQPEGEFTGWFSRGLLFSALPGR
jgi:hypothetical protein